jgi:3-hydroxybutyrate dehydrogenase
VDVQTQPTSNGAPGPQAGESANDPLAGSVALVTGAGSGIGRAIASALSTRGMGVLGVDLEPDGIVDAVPWEADLMDPAANAAAVQAALDRFGRLDVVVACAGVQHVAPIAEFPIERWQALIALMLTSPFLLARAAWPALQASGAGRFIAIASAHSLVASPYKAAYVSAKHGVLGLVKTLALEGAEDGIRAVAVCPAYVRTPLVEAQIPSQAAHHGVSEERALTDVILAPQAIRELIEPAEVAEVVAFLCGPGGRSFSGAPVTMDLGWTAR